MGLPTKVGFQPTLPTILVKSFISKGFSQSVSSLLCFFVPTLPVGYRLFLNYWVTRGFMNPFEPFFCQSVKSVVSR